MKKQQKKTAHHWMSPTIKFPGGHIQIVNPRRPIENVWSDILYLKPKAEFPAHSHKDTASLLVCIGGSGEVGINGNRTHLRKGVCAFIPRGAEHYVRARATSSLTCLSLNEGIIKPGATADIRFANPRLVNNLRAWSEFVANCGNAAADFQEKINADGEPCNVFSLAL